jgi:anti-anti-sigma factor
MAKSTLDVKVTQDGEVVVAVLSGPVDSATMGDFRKALDPLFRGKPGTILLDCKELTYMNSKAIGLLAKYRRDHYVAGGRMAICSLNKRLVRTMDLLGLGSTLKTYESKEEALKALG